MCPLQVFSCSTETPHTVASSSIFVYLMQFVQKTVQTGEVSISFPCPSGPPRKPLYTHLLVTVGPGPCVPPTFRGEEERSTLESSAFLPYLLCCALYLKSRPCPCSLRGRRDWLGEPACESVAALSSCSDFSALSVTTWKRCLLCRGSARTTLLHRQKQGHWCLV